MLVPVIATQIHIKVPHNFHIKNVSKVSRNFPSPHLTPPHTTPPHLTSSLLTPPHPTSPQPTSPHPTPPQLTPPHLTQPRLTSPHLTSPHPTSPHLPDVRSWNPMTSSIVRRAEELLRSTWWHRKSYSRVLGGTGAAPGQRTLRHNYPALHQGISG